MSAPLLVTFKAKADAGHIRLPTLARRHCDLHAFRMSRRFGMYANSDMFPSMLNRAVQEAARAGGMVNFIDAATPPPGFTVTPGFLHTVTVELPDNA